MRALTFPRALSALQGAILVLLAALYLLKVFNSLDWRMEHDPPLLHYVAFLIDAYDLVPYRDVFETSMPGTFAFHYAVGSLFGFGDVAFRCVDLTLLGAMLAATFLFMSRFGRLPAAWSVVVFGLVYLQQGQSMGLQRDYLGIVPVAFSLLSIPATAGVAVRRYRFALLGLLSGLAVLIKPHLGMALPVVFAALLAFRWGFAWKSIADLLRCAAVCAVSFLAPIALALAWLAMHSALGAFATMFFEYLPLHGAMTGSYENISMPRMVFYLIKHTLLFGGYGPLLLCSLLGYSRILERAPEDKATLTSLATLLLCVSFYAIYPTLAAKFWSYHYMPLAYFCTLSASLAVFAWPRPASPSYVDRLREVVPMLALLVAVTVQLHLPMYAINTVRETRATPESRAPKDGRVDEIADWLKSRLRAGDSVQPLDWTGGSIHALLVAEARLATRFMYDYHFYHHISTPIVQRLRVEFIDQFRAVSPRFVIAVIDEEKPWVSGIDSTREFPQLQRLMAERYAPAFEGEGYVIYELR